MVRSKGGGGSGGSKGGEGVVRSKGGEREW